MMKNDKKVKLNLGSGKDYIEDFINVDIVQGYKVDVVADLTKTFPFADNSVDEINASDILEHFIKEDGENFLEECFRVLKKDGLITIRTHNIFQIIKQFSADPQVMIHFLYGNTQETEVFGAHKFAYTQNSLKTILVRLGFKIVTFQNEQTNFLVVAKKVRVDLPKLTIAVIQQTPDVGGAETYMCSLVSEFYKAGHRIILTSNNNKFIKLFKQVKIKTYKIPIILDVIGNYRGLIKSILNLPIACYFYIKLLLTLKKQKTDIILMSGFSEKMLVSFISIFIRIPVVWIEYGPLTTIFRRNFYLPKILYRLVNKIPKSVIVPSNNTLQSMIRDARVSLAKLALIPCGVKIPQTTKPSDRKSFPKLKNKFVIGNVSRLTREKGQQYILQSMPEILKYIPNAHLILIGDGPDKAHYTRLIKELGVEEYVWITGFVQDLPAF